MGFVKTWTPQPHKHWQDKDGRKVSIFGAVPFYSEAQRDAEGWHIVTTGWTVYNCKTGTYGCGRPPFQTEDEAIDWCRRENQRLQRASEAMERMRRWEAWARANGKNPEMVGRVIRVNGTLGVFDGLEHGHDGLVFCWIEETGAFHQSPLAEIGMVEVL